MLAHVCARADTAITDARFETSSLGPGLAARLPALAAELHDHALDVALRGWAVEDADARAAIAAIDGARLALLEELWNAVFGDPRAARTAALLPTSSPSARASPGPPRRRPRRRLPRARAPRPLDTASGSALPRVAGAA